MQGNRILNRNLCEDSCDRPHPCAHCVPIKALGRALQRLRELEEDALRLASQNAELEQSLEELKERESLLGLGSGLVWVCGWACQRPVNPRCPAAYMPGHGKFPGEG